MHGRLGRFVPSRRLIGAAVTALSLSGCANFWDDVTSRDFHFGEFFRKPNPFLVLRDSDDGNRRARALRALEEPKQHNGNDHDQDAVVNILTAAATTERQPLCLDIDGCAHSLAAADSGLGDRLRRTREQAGHTAFAV